MNLLHQVYYFNQTKIMMTKDISLFADTDQAREQLARKHLDIGNQKYSVVAISTEIAPIANVLARILHADLTILPFEKIKDPADPLKSIGEVSFDFAITNDLSRDIPQDYIYHQGRKLRSDLISRYPDIYSAMASVFKNRCVFLVEGSTQSSERIIACLNSIRKQRPKKIIAVVPAITPAAAAEISGKVDELIFHDVASEDLDTGHINEITGSDDSTADSMITLGLRKYVKNIMEK
jgi:putative phosphoribosyl transferase